MYPFVAGVAKKCSRLFCLTWNHGSVYKTLYYLRITKVILNMTEPTMIPLKIQTRERLKRAGIKGETYDTIINRLLNCQDEKTDA